MLSCEKENSISPKYHWTANIGSSIHSYSTESFPSTDTGYALASNIYPGISSSSIILSDKGGYPSFRFFGGGNFALTPGTYIFNNFNSSSNRFFTVVVSTDLYYTTLNIPNTEITLNIEYVGNVGGFIIGSFSGRLGNQSTIPPYTITYRNVKGNFKAYRAR